MRTNRTVVNNTQSLVLSHLMLEIVPQFIWCRQNSMNYLNFIILSYQQNILRFFLLRFIKVCFKAFNTFNVIWNILALKITVYDGVFYLWRLWLVSIFTKSYMSLHCWPLFIYLNHRGISTNKRKKTGSTFEKTELTGSRLVHLNVVH